MSRSRVTGNAQLSAPTEQGLCPKGHQVADSGWEVRVHAKGTEQKTAVEKHDAREGVLDQREQEATMYTPVHNHATLQSTGRHERHPRP